jgi:hypothetical protein
MVSTHGELMLVRDPERNSKLSRFFTCGAKEYFYKLLEELTA